MSDGGGHVLHGQRALFSIFGLYDTMTLFVFRRQLAASQDYVSLEFLNRHLLG